MNAQRIDAMHHAITEAPTGTDMVLRALAREGVVACTE